MSVDARGSGYPPEEYRALYQRLWTAARDLPTVTQVAMTQRLPLDVWNSGRRFSVPGSDLFGSDEFDIVQSASVGPGFFEVIGISILRGRSFTESDRVGAPPVAIVSQVAASRFWPDREAVGQFIRTQSDPTTDIRVVGVAANAKVRTLGESPRWYIYLPFQQYPSSAMQAVIKGNLPAPELVAAGRAAVIGVDPGLFITDARTLEQHMDVILYLPKMAAMLFTVFACLALVLASIGLYGVVSFAVSRRTREMGIRISLGAQAHDVTWLVVRGGMMLVAVGGLVGLALSVGVGRFVEGFLLGVRGLDTVTLVVIPLILAGVSFVAAYLPARRAGRVSPMEALRAE